ncbi:MAG: DUF3416 domain-containing protein [Salinarimonadaceae bacterium]|nr:MAG: DUF3416 domain-containing protein [Salinarimonadaceae bacterium]
MKTGRATRGARVYYVHHAAIGAADRLPAIFDQARDLGFAKVLLSPLWTPGKAGDVFFPADHDRPHPGLAAGDDLGALVSRLVEEAGKRSLALMLDLAPRRFALDHPFVAQEPSAFTVRPEPAEGPLDPRAQAGMTGAAWVRPDERSLERLRAFLAPRLADFAARGVAGFRALRPSANEAPLWRWIIDEARAREPETMFVADLTGVAHDEFAALAGCGFDYALSSLPWWDYRASWLVEEHAALAAVAPVMTMPEAPFATRLAERVGDARHVVRASERAIDAAAALGCGLLVPQGFEAAEKRPFDARAVNGEFSDAPGADPAIAEAIRRANARIAATSALREPALLRSLTSPGAPISAVSRAPVDARVAQDVLLALFNPDLAESARVDLAALRPRIGGVFGPFTLREGREEEILDGAVDIPPGAVVLAQARHAPPVAAPKPGGAVAARAAAQAPRIVVEALSPCIDGGRHAVRRVVGESIAVTVDAFCDGHEMLALELCWRAIDEKEWRRARMQPMEPDRFAATIRPERMGRHEYFAQAWIDQYGGYVRDIGRKHEAGVLTPVDLAEGRLMIEAAHGRSKRDLRRRLGALLKAFDAADAPGCVEILAGADARALMQEADPRPFVAQSVVQPVEVERPQAAFASWYELFPRSQTDDPRRHGTFRDVIARLPHIRDMGFDVLYFPPIHPIGEKNRKGRNNTLTPGPDDVGSPYAIGAKEGGHDALHPELGTIEDFRALRDAAMAHEIELALDFAIQCAPDHPWLKDRPDWFDWRPDGSIKYAENPPKKYQDIVNVDFYATGAVPDLWIALRDVVLFWVGEGVKIFRVDNPHTKPLPFWEWMIAEVRARDPDVIFLSEAFTKPRMMYRLAKIGFSQSYTYFTWRNEKAELQTYLEELTTTAPKEFFRPHFFVNTPDINPFYLQRSGRPGFLVRACLAATLSGLWGVYSGFELLEAEPLPGKEEYKDSEKYEIRPRPERASGDIVDEITRLNRIRKANPALQTHLNVRFHNAFNDNILYYGKPSPDGDETILVAVNLDPHHAQEADIEVPLWEFGLPDDGAVEVDDLFTQSAFLWRGKIQRIRLDPAERPFAIWRIRPNRRS